MVSTNSHGRYRMNIFSRGFILASLVQSLAGLDSEEDRACRVFAERMVRRRTSGSEKTQCTDGVCLGLRWETSSRKSVTSSKESPDARSIYPVTCSEATYYNKKFHQSGQDAKTIQDADKRSIKTNYLTRQCEDLDRLTFRESLTRQRSRCVHGICQDIRWRDSKRVKVINSYKEGFPISCYEAAGMMIVHRRFHVRGLRNGVSSGKTQESIPQSVGGVELHYHPSLKDGRTRVSVKFTSQKESNSVPFSLLFDSGATKTFVRMRKKDDGNSTSFGYLDNGQGKPIHEVAWYGADFGNTKAVFVKEVQEKASVGENEFNLSLRLAEQCGDKYIDAGILGAGINSEFTRIFKSFAVVPPKVQFKRFEATGSAGTLYIGNHEWRQFCRGRNDPIYTQVRSDVSNIHWIIDGSVKIGDYETPAMNWIVDTGAQGLMVTEQVYMKLRDIIHGIGGYMPNATPGLYNEIENCVQLYSNFPTIEIQAGDRSNPYVLHLKPLDYLGSFNHENGMCLMMLDYSTMGRVPNTGILGTKFFERTTTIFDHMNRQMGFCFPAV